jgi:hypothetical protein
MDVPQPLGLLYYTMLWTFALALPGVPTSTTMRETPSSERGNCGREMTSNFADNGGFHAIVGIFYTPKICDMGLTALLPLRRKACWGFLHPEKSDGFSRVQTCELGYQRPAKSVIKNRTLYSKHEMHMLSNSSSWCSLCEASSVHHCFNTFLSTFLMTQRKHMSKLRVVSLLRPYLRF